MEKDVDLKEFSEDPLSWAKTISMAMHLTENQTLDGSPFAPQEKMNGTDGIQTGKDISKELELEIRRG